MSKPKVAILHGLGEGPRLSRGLRQELIKNNFDVTDDLDKADIYITHSGGCLLLPEDLDKKTVLLIGPDNGHHQKSLYLTELGRMADYVLLCIRKGYFSWLIYKSFWNFTHLITSATTKEMIRLAKQNGKAPLQINARCGIIVYRGDPWNVGMREIITTSQPTTYISHRGIHDDIWINPAGYVAIVKYLHQNGAKHG